MYYKLLNIVEIRLGLWLAAIFSIDVLIGLFEISNLGVDDLRLGGGGLFLGLLV